MIDCASSETLQQLLAGTLPDAEACRLREHLSCCLPCQARMDQLSDHPALRNLLDASEPPSSPLPEMARLGPFLDHLRQTPFPQASAPVRPPGGVAFSFLGPPLQEGDLGTLGPYRVLSELGHGGMGVVFKAVDSVLQRTIALKVLWPERVDEKARSRFAREARAAAGLQHDHIVPVFAVTDLPGGPPYLTMQYVAGPTLRQRIRQEQRLDPKEAARVALQVADGLAAAHAAGLVHRDIKPSNIILEAATHSPEAGAVADGWRARITDFGLVRVLEGPSATTVEGMLRGTPEYMSPEQVGQPDQVDVRTDVYSLGVSLYEALTGEVPFRGMPHQVLQKVVADEPTPPRRLNDQIPPDLETICLKAMAKEPSRRYPSARDLAGDLGRWLRGEPIQARPAGPFERGWRWCRRNPRVAGLSAALLLALAVGFAGIFWQWRRAEAQLVQTQRQQARAEAGYRESRRAVDDFFTAVSEDDLLQTPGAQPLRKRLLEKARRYYQDFLAEHRDDPTLLPDLARASVRLGDITVALGKTAEAHTFRQEACDLFEQLVTAHPEAADYQKELALCYTRLYTTANLLGRQEEALGYLEQARRVWDRLAREHSDSPEFQTALARSDHHLGLAWEQAGRRDKALPFLEQARTRWEAFLREQPGNLHYQDNLYRLYVTIADCYRDEQPVKALPLYESAARFWEPLLQGEGDNPNSEVRQCLAYAYGHGATALAALGRSAEALDACRKACAILEPIAHANPELVAVRGELVEYYRQTAGLQDRAGRPQEAQASRERAAALERKTDAKARGSQGR